MSRDTRTPTSVTRIGRYTVRIYDEQAYAANIRCYYAGDASEKKVTGGRTMEPPVTFKKKPSARYDWASWRGGPMIKAV